MFDFWSRFDIPYRYFSQFCDSDDWQDILHVLASRVSTYGRSLARPVRILDVGCGSGVATATICEMAFAARGTFPVVSVVEPSPLARARLRSSLLACSDGGPLESVYASLDQIPKRRRFDVVFFVHSSYYIDNLPAALPRLVERHVAPGGRVCLLVLPQASAYFLGLPALPFCSDEVELLLRKIGMSVNTAVLRSRFRVPDGGFTPAELSRIRDFMQPSMAEDQFRDLFNEWFGRERSLDFGDHLLVGTRK